MIHVNLGGTGGFQFHFDFMSRAFIGDVGNQNFWSPVCFEFDFFAVVTLVYFFVNF